MGQGRVLGQLPVSDSDPDSMTPTLWPIATYKYATVIHLEKYRRPPEGSTTLTQPFFLNVEKVGLDQCVGTDAFTQLL
jgi:hypothetical protein